MPIKRIFGRGMSVWETYQERLKTRNIERRRIKGEVFEMFTTPNGRVEDLTITTADPRDQGRVTVTLECSPEVIFEKGYGSIDLMTPAERKAAGLPEKWNERGGAEQRYGSTEEEEGSYSSQEKQHVHQQGGGEVIVVTRLRIRFPKHFMSMQPGMEPRPDFSLWQKRLMVPVGEAVVQAIVESLEDEL